MNWFVKTTDEGNWWVPLVRKIILVHKHMYAFTVKGKELETSFLEAMLIHNFKSFAMENVWYSYYYLTVLKCIFFLFQDKESLVMRNTASKGAFIFRCLRIRYLLYMF